MSALNERMMLIQLNISQWTAKKLDKGVTNDVLVQKGAVQGSGRFNKDLLPNNKALKLVHQKTSEIRAEFYENTLPWGMAGTQILAAKNYLPFVDKFRTHKNKWNTLVEDFLSEYSTAITKAQTDLGTMFDPAVYPPRSVIEKKFNCDVTVMPVPSTDFRIQIVDSELEKVRASVEAKVTSSVRDAVVELWQRVLERVEAMAERLSDPDAEFRDSLVGNLEHVVELLPRMNFTDDPELSNISAEIKARLLNIKDPKVLRQDSQKRSMVAMQATVIANTMKAHMGTL